MSEGRGAADTPLRRAAHGSGGGDDAARHHRAPLPSDRSVLWTPNRDPDTPESPATSGPYEFFLTRSAMLEIGTHVADGEHEPRFGFLLGHLYRCPDTGVHYCVADATVPSSEPFSEDAPDPFLLRAWAGCQSVFRGHGGVLLGWYHSHYLLGLFLSDGDRAANERYFGEPWQCCVLLVPDPARPMGAVFRPSATSDDGSAEPMPFRELLAQEDVPAAGHPESAIQWTNYRPDREVKPVSGMSDPPRRTEAPPATQPVPGVGASPAAAGIDVSDRRSEPSRRRLPVWRRWPAWLVAAVAVGIGGTLGGLWLAGSGDVPPPVATEVETGEQALPTPSPEVQRFLDAATELQESMLRYGERRQDFDLGRIDCDLLAGGYAGASEASSGMEEAFTALAMEADGELAAEHDRLVEDMNGLQRHFEGSGCPHPE